MVDVRIRIEGADEVIRAARRFPDQCQDELRSGSLILATDLAAVIAGAGAARGRQTAMAAATVKAVPGRVMPTITAGGGARADAVLYGTEFGATRHFGWYHAGRYFRSRGKQFPPHLGGGSYWFFKTAEREQPRIERHWQNMADDMIRRWGA